MGADVEHHGLALGTVSRLTSFGRQEGRCRGLHG